MESVQKLAQGFQSLLTDRDKKKLAGYVQKLGFEDIAAMFYDLQPEGGKRVNKFPLRLSLRLPYIGHDSPEHINRATMLSTYFLSSICNFSIVIRSCFQIFNLCQEKSHLLQQNVELLIINNAYFAPSTEQTRSIKDPPKPTTILKVAFRTITDIYLLSYTSKNRDILNFNSNPSKCH